MVEADCPITTCYGKMNLIDAQVDLSNENEEPMLQDVYQCNVCNYVVIS